MSLLISINHDEIPAYKVPICGDHIGMCAYLSGLGNIVNVVKQDRLSIHRLHRPIPECSDKL